MKFAYLCEDGTKITVEGNTLLVKKGKETIAQLPINLLKSILVFGNSQATTDALSRLTRRGIRIAWLSRTGKLKFYVAGPENFAINKIRQHHCYLDKEKRLRIAREVFERKVYSQVFFLKNYFREIKEKGSFLEDAENLLEKSRSSRSLDEIRGYEGFLSRKYFELLKQVVKNQHFRFEGRKYHPCTDRFNCALSLAYGFCKQVICSAIVASGFDPFIGFLHEFTSSKEAFVYDMIEEFRPYVDWRVIKMINKKQLKEDMFLIESGGEVKICPKHFKAVVCLYHEQIIAFEEPRYGIPFYEAVGQSIELISNHIKEVYGS
ncbi:MAG: CRISPR-associated endonuclease Cas1 [Archaeoglobaceae archaeon]